MRGIAFGLMALAAVLAVACGSDAAREATRTPAVTASPSPQASATPAVTPTPPTGGPPVVSATPPSGGPPLGEPPTIAAPTPGTPPPGTHLEPAPIDDASIVVRESFPPQYAVHILSGMPSGCHHFESATVTRSGDVITIDVENRVTGGPDTACTAIYGTHESNVDLGSDFVSGKTYTVRVNDRVLELHAQ